MARRLIPVVTIGALALFTMAGGLWAISLGAADPAHAYAASPVCSSAVVVEHVPCRRLVPAVVTSTDVRDGNDGNGQNQQPSVHLITLSIGGGASGPQLEISDGDWPILAVKKGDQVTATIWSNRVTTVTSRTGTADVVGNFPDRAYPGILISVIMLVGALVVSRVGRVRLRHGLRRRVLRVVDAGVVPASGVAVIAFYADRSVPTILGIVVVGTIAEVSYLTAMPWRTTPAPGGRPRPRASDPAWSKAADEARVPVDPEQRAWIEESMRWFEGQFGKAAALGDVAIPTPEFLPADSWAIASEIRELFASICGRMEVDPSRIALVLPDGIEPEARGVRTVGRYRLSSGGGEVIELDTGDGRDPAYLAAVIAHELGHARLLGESRIVADRADGERLTDLLTVYLGFGVINANAALAFERTAHGWSAEPLTDQELSGSGHGPRRHLGYLSEAEFGYALACLCRLREDTAPAWASYLEPGPRAFLRRSLAALRRDG